MSLIFSLKEKRNNWNYELGELWTIPQVVSFEAPLRHLESSENTKKCFKVFVEAEGDWPIAKSIKNMIPMLMAMLHPRKTI